MTSPRTRFLASGWLATASLLTNPVLAQDSATKLLERPADITCSVKARAYIPGTQLSADLRSPDGQQTNGAPFVVFETSLDPEDQIALTVTGDGTFAPIVSIGRCRDGTFGRLAAAGPFSASVQGYLTKSVQTGLTIAEKGSYRIRVTSSDQRAGNLQLLGRKISLGTPPTITDLAIDATTTGELTQTSSRQAFGEAHYSLYRLTAPRSTRANVILTPKRGKPLILLGSSTEDPWQDYFIAQPVTKISPKVSVTLLPNSERIFKVVAPANDDAQYDIKVELAPEPREPPDPKRLSFGQELTGQLAFEDPVIAQRTASLPGVSGTFRRYQLYILSGNAGDHATITLQSSKIDPLLQIVARTVMEERLATVLSNDDHGSDDKALSRTDSRLDVEFAVKGDLLIRVTSALDSQYGEFKISVSPAAPPSQRR